MNCLHCGKPLKEGATFCSFCGTPVGSGANTTISRGSSAESGVRSEIIQKPKKKSRLGVALTVAIVVGFWLIILLGIGASLMPEKDTYTSLYTPVDAYIGRSGDAYICYGDGRYVAIEESGVKEAKLSPDRNYIAYITEDNKLVLNNVDQSDRRVIAHGDVESMSMEKSYMMYTIADHDVIYAYQYDTGNTSSIPVNDKAPDGVWTVSSPCGDGNAVMFVDYGEVYVGEFFGGVERIARYADDAEVDLFGISCDAKVALFGVDSEVFLYYRGEIISLGKFSEEEYRVGVALNVAIDSSDTVIISSIDRIFIKTRNNLSEIPMYSQIHLYDIMNAHGGVFGEERFIDADGFYVKIQDEDGDDSTLCYMSYDGVYREVIEGFTDMSFVGQSGIVCMTAYGELVYMDMDVEEGVVTGDRVTVAENVHDFKVSKEGGNYIYYTEPLNCLYCYDISEDSSQRISNDVFAYFVSTDGETVFYMEDHVGIRGNVYLELGSLYAYDSSFEESELIGEKVISDTVTSHLRSGEIDAQAMWFETFIESVQGGYICNANAYVDGDVRELITNIPTNA